MSFQGKTVLITGGASGIGTATCRRFAKEGYIPVIIDVNLEAAELLEIFQWSADDLECKDKLDKIKEELADILNYCVLFADRYGFDLDDIIRAKIEKNEEKYPIKEAYGNKAKYTELKEKQRKTCTIGR